MDETFFIDIWSDVVCPFCYIGSRQLTAALERFEHRDRVVVRHRAFEIDPRAAAHYEYGLDELVAIKYGLSIERARTLNHRLEDRASRLAMTWSLERAQPTNTFDAHRLLALASVKGRATALNERLFRAYFSEGRLLSDHVTLSELAGEIGLDGSDELWRGAAYADRVRNDERWAQELAITGVPTILLDGAHRVAGAKEPIEILENLERAWRQRARA